MECVSLILGGTLGLMVEKPPELDKAGSILKAYCTFKCSLYFFLSQSLESSYSEYLNDLAIETIHQICERWPLQTSQWWLCLMPRLGFLLSSWYLFNSFMPV